MANAWLAHVRGALALLGLFGILATTAVAQSSDDLAALNGQVVKLFGEGKYSEARAIANQSLALAEKKFGPDNAEVGTSLNNLATIYRAQGSYTQAEPLYKRALSIREMVLGPDHLDVGESLNNLAGLYRSQGRYAEAEPLYKRTLTLREKALGPDHPEVGELFNNLAGLYQSQGHYAEAEAFYKRSIGIREKSLGQNHPALIPALNNLANLFREQGRYTESEPLYKRSISLIEEVFGPDHPRAATLLNNLAELYQAQGRFAESESLYKRSLALMETIFGPDHPDVASLLNNLGELYRAQERYYDAEPLFKRSLGLRERSLGMDHPDVGSTLNSLALLYTSLGRYAEAEPLFKRDLVISEKRLGPGHPDVGVALNNLAGLYKKVGKFSEAEIHYERDLAISQRVFGLDHPSVGDSFNNFAALYFIQRNWSRAIDFWRRSAAIIKHRFERGEADAWSHSSGLLQSEADKLGSRSQGLIKALYASKTEQVDNTTASSAEAFTSAQWVQGSHAAASLAQMAARGASGNPNLATIVRERQDLSNEWKRRDSARTIALSQSSAKRQPNVEASNLARLTEIDARLAVMDTRLASEFPDYAALATFQPVTVERVQADLRPDEALVLFLDTPKWEPTPEETFVWVVTKTDVRWLRSDRGTPALTREVAALRCGLDYTGWRGSNCVELTGKTYTEADRKAGKPLPFDPDRAHKIYKALFGQVEELIKGKHLLLVPSGPLTQLPFQVLVTAPTAGDGTKAIRWLARDHAITVLPAVSSLKDLRRLGKPSAATEAMIGFGNPLLDGRRDHPQYGDYFKKQAALARADQSCPDKPWQRLAALFGASRDVEPVATRGGLADLAHLRSQAPLPETARELCEVASSLNVDRKNIWLGARATETNIKRLSAATDATRLANYRIVHFATHGTLAGQLSGTTEPGLLLTPPDKATEEDDGYLSAGEIAGLKLDAEWVILSACNTAAGNAKGAEALGGLARAFFYAGARALLVSHWEVDSEATVKLITSAVGTMAKDKSVGRAEALRRAMLNMIDNGQPHEAHPAYWAPFVVVGEGSAGR